MFMLCSLQTKDITLGFHNPIPNGVALLIRVNTPNIQTKHFPRHKVAIYSKQREDCATSMFKHTAKRDTHKKPSQEALIRPLLLKLILGAILPR